MTTLVDIMQRHFLQQRHVPIFLTVVPVQMILDVRLIPCLKNNDNQCLKNNDTREPSLMRVRIKKSETLGCGQ